MSPRSFLIVAALTACVDPSSPVAESTQEAVSGSTVISLTFDDTFADNFQVGALAEARGMRATFFVNSGRIGQTGSLSLNQLLALQQAGHEIGGHTITHARLADVPTDDARRQVCDDRSSLLEGGFRVTSFAYPFSSQNASVRQIAADCGYNSARLVGGLVMPTSCNGCPYANPMPPVDPFGVRTNDSVDATTTLDLKKLYVTQAEQHGGGWVPMVFHHVCDGCDSLAISPATLATFLDWLAARSAQGTVVATVDQVMGGAVKPAVAGPLPPPQPSATNMLQNASLETDSNGDQVPDCWQRGGSGTNTGTYTLSSTAYDGTRAQRIDVTSFTSGARRLVSLQDAGTCAPAITPGHRYTVSASYIANSQPLFSIYYRNTSGSWVWFAQSPRLPTSSSYVIGSYTTPALPADATAISVGLSLVGVGSLTMDAYTLVDAAGSTAETTPPAVSLTMPSAGATVNGIVQIAATATDASAVARVEFLANGTVIATDRTNPYWIAWNTAAYTGQNVTLSARAVDTLGNTATSSTRQVTVGSAQDTTPPTVALTSPADGATVTGTVPLTADASDAGGIARVELYANGTLLATELTSPYAIDWDTTAYAGTTVTLLARAFDAAGNSADSASRQVTVAAATDTTPPAIALTSPADAATVSGTVLVTADASDAGGIARVEFYAGSTLFATDVDSPYAADWDTTPYAGTAVTLVARAFDAAGNSADSAARQVNVTATSSDTTPPTVALTNPAAGATVTGTVLLSADASDAGGIARVELFANGVLLATDLTAPYETNWDTAPYAGTTVTLVARAYDSAGNTTTSAARQVAVATATATNLVKNPSLEINANGDQVPDCWQRGGSGTNAATFTLTSNAFSGSVAQRIDMTSYSSGARRLVTLQDSGTCAPAASPGRRYTVSARYLANTQPVFTIYYRNASGTWVFFAQSPSLPTSTTYRLGSFTTAALPAGATAISVGLSIINLGSLTMDDFTLVDAGT
jgi:peptidoglycan/xylan/chitin deacetylase (PgdA/CDA1 family)